MFFFEAGRGPIALPKEGRPWKARRTAKEKKAPKDRDPTRPLHFLGSGSRLATQNWRLPRAPDGQNHTSFAITLLLDVYTAFRVPFVSNGAQYYQGVS